MSPEEAHSKVERLQSERQALRAAGATPSALEANRVLLCSAIRDHNLAMLGSVQVNS